MKFCMIIFVFVLTSLPMMFSTCTTSRDDIAGEYCTKNRKDGDNEVRILLIGKTGVGKSTTGNTILGFRAFKSRVSASLITGKTWYDETFRFGKKLVVVDTPGYFDTTQTEEEILAEMTKWYLLVSPGIHAIVLVVQVGRFTNEDQKTIDFYMKIFGKDLQDYLVIVFTDKDRLEDSNMTIDDFVNTLKKSSNLRKLIDESKGRYTAIGYRGREEDREKEVKHILSMIDGIKGKDGRNYYSNDVFKKVQYLLENFEEKKKEELRDEVVYMHPKNLVQLLQGIRSETRRNIFNGDIMEEWWIKLSSIVCTEILKLIGKYIVDGISPGFLLAKEMIEFYLNE